MKRVLAVAAAAGLLLGAGGALAGERVKDGATEVASASIEALVAKFAAPRMATTPPRAGVSTAQACLPNGFCWAPGLPSCCSGTCTSTPKCPGVQECLCE